MNELQMLIQKIRAGANIVDAYNDIVHKSLTDLRKIAGDSDSFSLPQFWALCKALAKNSKVGFDELKLLPAFNSDSKPIFGLEEKGIIGIAVHDGRPVSVHAGKPVYRRVFQTLMADQSYAASMDLQTFKDLQSAEQAKIAKYESELKVLTEIITGGGSDRNFLPRSSRNSLEERVWFLTNSLSESHKKFSDYEEGIKRCKKLLQVK